MSPSKNAPTTSSLDPADTLSTQSGYHSHSRSRSPYTQGSEPIHLENPTQPLARLRGPSTGPPSTFLPSQSASSLEPSSTSQLQPPLIPFQSRPHVRRSPGLQSVPEVQHRRTPQPPAASDTSRPDLRGFRTQILQGEALDRIPERVLYDSEPQIHRVRNPDEVLKYLRHGQSSESDVVIFQHDIHNSEGHVRHAEASGETFEHIYDELSP